MKIRNCYYLVVCMVGLVNGLVAQERVMATPPTDAQQAVCVVDLGLYKLLRIICSNSEKRSHALSLDHVATQEDRKQCDATLRLATETLGLLGDVVDGFNKGCFNGNKALKQQFVTVCNVVNVQASIEPHVLREQCRQLTAFCKSVDQYCVSCKGFLNKDDLVLLGNIISLCQAMTDSLLQDELFDISWTDNVVDCLWYRPAEFAANHKKLVLTIGFVGLAVLGCYWYLQGNRESRVGGGGGTSAPPLQSPTTAVVGLRNGGNNCWFNAPAQCLFRLNTLDGALQGNQARINTLLASADDQAQKSARVMQTWCNLQHNLCPRVADTGAVHTAVREAYFQGSHDTSQDASNFINHFVNDLRQRFNIGLFDTPVVTSTAYGQCPMCHASTQSPGQRVTLSTLPLFVFGDVPNQTLQEYINRFFSPRVVGNRLAPCGHRCPTTLQTRLEGYPEILTLSLQGHDTGKRLVIPQAFNLATCCGAQPPQGNGQYDLVGIVAYSSNPQIHYGHYVALTRAPNGTWHFFDDETVRPVNNIQAILEAGVDREPEHVCGGVHPLPYILFYKKRNVSST